MSKHLVNIFKQIPFRRGKWIAPRKSKDVKNFYFRARNQFELSEIPEKAVLHIGAESYYLLYVNGTEVGRGPVRGTHRHNYYDSYEIASLLQTGHNVIAVLVQCMNYDTFVAAPSQPGLIVELNGMIASNATWEVNSAVDWRRDVQTYSWQAGYCEWRDLRLEPIGWTTDDDSVIWEAAWEIPKSSKIYTKELLPRAIPALTEKTIYPVDIPVIAKVPPLTDLDDIEIYKIMKDEKYTTLRKEQVTLLTGQDGCTRIEPVDDGSGTTVVFDFGAEICGRFELYITAPEGCIIDICHNEAIKNDRLAVNHLLEQYHFVDRYILREGRQKIGNTLYERGFKMVQIVCRNFTAPIEIHQAKAIDARYPFVRHASFNCDDLLLNRIWDACCETLESCTTDVFTDCPWRERAFWVNDLIVENMTSLQAFGVSEVYRRAFRLAFSDAREGGIIPGVCPCPEDGDNLVLIPTNLFIIFMLKDYLMYSNDKELIKELMPNIISIIDTFSKWEDENGFILPPEKYWNFFDWSFELNKVSLNGKLTSLLSYLYVTAMKNIIELADITGEKIDCAKYESKIKKTSSNLEECFFKEDEKHLADWIDEDGRSAHSSQLAHAFALLSGECSQDMRKYFEAALSDKNLLMPEMYLHYFIFHAMELCGKEAEVLERIRKYWGDIVKTGSSTIWEAGIHRHGKDAFSGDGSLCHGFSTSPIDFFQTVILGIEPLSPGFKTFKVAPVILDIEFAEGRIPTPYGNISIKWKRKNNYLKVELKVPEGTIAKTVGGNSYFAGKHNFKLSIKDKNNA
jgi:alpha-L-rhamnosidase